MHEYARVTVSTFDLDNLVHQLNDRGKEGWSVVSILPTGGDVTAILQRPTADPATAMPVEYAHLEPSGSAAPADAAVAAVAVAAATEAAPAPDLVEPSPWAPTPEPAAAPTPAPAPAAPSAAATGLAASAPVVTTPAGWYPDPSGRFELRYWDGGQWTEYVSRAGQQFTDPPVA